MLAEDCVYSDEVQRCFREVLLDALVLWVSLGGSLAGQISNYLSGYVKYLLNKKLVLNVTSAFFFPVLSWEYK